MDVEFFIHGVPKGESFWGKSEEKNFLGQFYDGKTDVKGTERSVYKTLCPKIG